jgi:iron complex transport system permease protein
VAALALSFGSSGFGGFELLGALASGELDATQRAILVQARLPRVIMAGVVGAALACSGACFQGLLRNPLADPYVLGISGGAALGATLLMSLGGGWLAAATLGVPAAAFVGAAGALALLYAAERWMPPGRAGNAMLLLTGVIFNAFASAIIMFLKAIVSAQKAQELLFYLMGTLSVEGMGGGQLTVVAAVTGAGLLGLFGLSSELNLLSLGREEAAALGVDTARSRRITLVLASVIVAVAVAFTGLIGFVGLVVPHALRLAVGPDNRLLLPACALGGAAFLTGCDLVARLSFDLFATSLPVGVVTATIGAPIFIYFMFRNLRGPSIA